MTRWSKYVSVSLVVALIISAFSVQCFATETITKDNVFSFFDDFGETAVTDIVCSEAVENKIGDNWATSKVWRGDSGYWLKSGISEAIEGMSLDMSQGGGNKQGMVNLKADRTGLTANQVIEYDTKRGSQDDVLFGSRFMVSADEKSFYEIGFYRWTDEIAGQATKYKRPYFKRVVNGVTTDTIVNDIGVKQELDFSKKFHVKITVVDGKISWDITCPELSYSWSDSFTDKEPMIRSGNDCGFGFFSKGTKIVYFDNFSISSYVPYVTGEEPNNVMYIDAAQGKEINNGVIDLGKEYALRRIVAANTDAETAILVSNDNATWYELVSAGNFADGSFLNNITANKYRYVKLTGNGTDLKVLTDISEISIVQDGKGFKLYPRVNGTDAFTQAEYNLKDTGIVSIEDGVITPKSMGNTLLTVNVGDNSFEIPVKVSYPMVAQDKAFTIKDDFGTTSLSDIVCDTAQENVINANWKTSSVWRGDSGYWLKAGICEAIDGMSLDMSQGGENKQGTVNLTADRTGLSANQVIEYDAKRGSGDDVVFGSRFMISSDEKSYYELGFFRWKDEVAGINTKYKRPYFKRVVNGATTELIINDIGKREELDFSKKYHVVITLLDGTVTWNITCAETGYSWTDSYTDAEPMQREGNDCGFAFFSKGTKVAYFDNFSISSYNPYITSPEPSNVMYIDAAEGKLVQNGVVDLNTPCTIRRLIVNGADETTSVLVSNDGSKWNTLAQCNTLTTGMFLNTITGNKYQYVKLEGNGSDLKVLTDVERIEASFDSDPIKLYPRVNGTDVFTDAVITSGNQEIVTVANNSLNPVSTGDTTISVTVDDKVFEVPVKISVTSQATNSVFNFSDNFGTEALADIVCSEDTTNRINDNWSTSKVWRGDSGYWLKAGISQGIDGMSLDMSQGGGNKQGTVNLTADRTGLSENQVIEYDAKRGSQDDVLFGSRFMVSSDEKSYYEMGFFRWSDEIAGQATKYKRPYFKRVVNGTTTDLIVDDIGTKAELDFSKNFHVKITVADGSISWVITCPELNYSWSSSFDDSEPMQLSGNDCGFAFFSKGTKIVYFDNFKIKSLISYIETNEPQNVMYQDVVFGKVPYDNIYNIGAAAPIRRIAAKNAENVVVSLSKDGTRWLKLCDGPEEKGDFDYINQNYAQPFKYIKVEGNYTDLKVFTDVNDKTFNLSLGNSVALYPRISGVLNETVVWESEVGGIIAVTGNHVTAIGPTEPENPVKLTATKGEISLNVYFNVLDGISVNRESGKVNIKVDVNSFIENYDEITAMVVFKDSSNKIISIQRLPIDLANANGDTVTVVANDDNTIGSIGKVLIWANDITSLMPLVSSYEIN